RIGRGRDNPDQRAVERALDDVVGRDVGVDRNRDVRNDVAFDVEIRGDRCRPALDAPEFDGARGVVAPQHIGDAVSVEVTHSRDGRGGARRGRIKRRAGPVAAAHDPAVVFAGRLVTPQDVAGAVTVEIANAGDLEGR